MRMVEIQDLPWILDLAEHRYPAFDRAAAEHWLLDVLKSPAHFFAIDNGTVILGQLSAFVWAPQEIIATMLFLLGPEKVIDVFASLRLLKALAHWAGAGRAADLFFGTSGGVDVDLAPLARRLGARADNRQSFILPLCSE